MKAFVIDSIGDRGNVAEVDRPTAAADEVLVTVEAVGLIASDWRVRSGSRIHRQEHRFPAILGFDFAGRIAETPTAGPWMVGDRVFGIAHKPFIGAGCLAEFVTLPFNGPLARTPDPITSVQAAAIVSGGVTAQVTLDDVPIREGDTVVLVGASGGVGTILTQLLAKRGAEVIAVAKEANEAYVTELGASHTVLRDRVDVVADLEARWPSGVDVLIDLIGNAEQFALLCQRVRSGGWAASAVGSWAASERSDIHGVDVRAVPLPERMQRLARSVAAAEFTFPEIRVVPLAEVASALDLLERGGARGKLVVEF